MRLSGLTERLLRHSGVPRNDKPEPNCPRPTGIKPKGISAWGNNHIYVELLGYPCYDIGVMARYILPIEIQHLDEGVYLATSPALPGFLVQADTVEEVMELAPGVAQALIEAMQENGVPLPETLQATEPPFHADLLVPV